MITTTAPNPDINDSTARTVLLQDAEGRIQVILPTPSMLDLKTLHKATGRELQPISQSRLSQLVAGGEITPLDGMPGLFLMETVIDEEAENLGNCRFAVQIVAARDEAVTVETGIDPEVEVETAPADTYRVFDADLSEIKNALGDTRFGIKVLKVSLAPGSLRAPLSDPAQDQGQIISSVKSFTNLRIQQRLEETLEIPALSLTAQRIIRLRANPGAVVSDLADIVKADASLAAQVVSWAASPFYAATGRIQSVQEAIQRVLGFDLVSNLALGLTMGKTLSLPKDSSISVTAYWLQSVYCSTLTDALVQQIPARLRPSQGLACLSGLMHNFGYLVLAHVFPPHFALVNRYLEANPAVSHVIIEQHLLQITREQVGSCLMQLWNMPEEVCTALRFQHEPDYGGKHDVYAHLIFMALRLLRKQGIGDAPPEEIPQALLDRYELDAERVQAAVDRVLAGDEEMRKIAGSFGG